jgi:uncharacterized Zn-binding protein involved in type VI secretion
MVATHALVALVALADAAGTAQPTPAAPAPKEACPQVVTTGSATVAAEGKSAGRRGDKACGVALQGPTDVMINGRPALRVGDSVACANGKTGIVVGGATSVYVNGRPLAGPGSKIVGCD